MLFKKGRDLKITLLFKMDKTPITRNNQSLYVSALGYYKAISFLKKHGLIECIGVDKNNQKIWKLTEKGKKFVSLLKEIKTLLMETYEEKEEVK